MAALLTAFILLALVASLFWIIAATSRQAEYAKNAAISLNLAEAGVADAIYRLNYCTGATPSDYYPFFGTSFPFDTIGNDTSFLINLPNSILNSFSYPNLYTGNQAGIQGSLGGGSYCVGIMIDSDDTSPDTLISVGIYKGIKRVLEVPLRGNNSTSSVRHPSSPPSPPVTQGISEAFNKHAIYAKNINYTNGQINGNIAYAENLSGNPTGCTITKVDPQLFGPPVPNSIPDVVIDPAIPSTSWGTSNFKDDDGVGSSYTRASLAYDIFPGPYAGSSSPPLETYTLDSTCYIGNGESWRFEKSNTNLVVYIDLNNPPTILGRIDVINGSVTIVGTTSNQTIGSFSPGNVTIWAGEDINIQPGNGILTINGDIYAQAATNPTSFGIKITTNGNGRINGFLKSGGIISIANGNTVGTQTNPTGVIANGKITIGDNSAGTGPTIYGMVASGSEIEIRGNGSPTIDASGSDTTLLVSSFSSATVTISCSPNLTLSPDAFRQRAALMVFGTTATTNINADFQPDYNNRVRPAVVSHGSPGPSQVNIGTSGSDVDIDGVIYSWGAGDSGNITLGSNTGTISGALVANGDVTLSGANLNLAYDPAIFRDAEVASDIFYGFGAGQRTYLPAWGRWRLR